MPDALSDDTKPSDILRFSRLLIVLLTAFGLSSSAFAQTPDTYGLAFGYEFGTPLDISRDPGTTNPLEFPLTGLSQSHSAYLGLSYIWPEVFSDLHLRIGTGYTFSLGRFVSDVYFDSAGVKFSDFQVESDRIALKQFYVNSRSHLFSPSVTLDWQPGVNWQMGFGLWGAVNLGSTLDRREELTDDDRNLNLFFRETLGRQRDLSNDGVEFRSFRWGPSVSMSWKLSGGRNVDIRPEIFGKLDVTSAGELGERAFSAGIRLNVLLNSDSRIPEFADPGKAVQELPPLSAAVRITSNGISLDAPVAAQPRSVLHRKFETVLPFIEIPTVTDRDRVSSMIDVLGKRIGESQATIALVPSAAENILELAGNELKDSIKLAAQRYQINNPVVNVQSAQRNRGTEQLPSGLLVTTDQQTVLRPMADQWIESKYQLPPITIERYTDSRVGIKSWSVIVRQGRRTLARYTNLEGSNAELESGLFLSQNDNAAIAPILAEMTVTDLSDQAITVFDTLHLTKGVADPNRADSTVYEYLFYSTSSNSSVFDVLGVSRKLLIKTLRDQLASTDNIEIQYSAGSMNLASELLTEITKIAAESSSSGSSGSPEIKMRLVRDLVAPRTIQSARVLQSN